MSSERRVYVFIQLPGSTEIVPCGLFVHEQTRAGPVGRFRYARSYRARPDAVPLDPIELPVLARTFETRRLQGLFGALRDAAPDAWGRYVIDRREGRTGFDDLDYLVRTSGERSGALFFTTSLDEPPRPAPPHRLEFLRDVRDAVRALEESTSGDPLDPEIRARLAPGTSLGGARPKADLQGEDRFWIAKFPAKGDRWSNAVAEAGMLALARRCGIRTPHAEIEPVGDEKVLLVERFDRAATPDGVLRHRVLSALSALRASESATERARWSYPLLAGEIQRRSVRPDSDKPELFRRMVFNALITNTDDHPRNHALVAPGADWELAPAFDLVPRPEVSLEERHLALEVGEHGRLARRDNLLSSAPRFGLGREEAGAIIDRMKGIVERHWEDELRRMGAVQGDIQLLAPAFLYPGFEYETGPLP